MNGPLHTKGQYHCQFTRTPRFCVFFKQITHRRVQQSAGCVDRLQQARREQATNDVEFHKVCPAPVLHRQLRYRTLSWLRDSETVLNVLRTGPGQHARPTPSTGLRHPSFNHCLFSYATGPRKL